MAAKKEVLNYKALVTTLRRDGPQRLYMFWGEEDYLIAAFVEELRRACLPGGGTDFDEKRLNGPALDLRDLRDALDAMPFMSERTFVDLRGVDINKCTDEKYAALLSDVPEWCTVVITLPAEGKPDGRLSIVKTVKKIGCAVEFTAQPESEIFKWLQKRFAAHGKRIGRTEMERLCFLSGDLMNRLIPEIDKICAYAKGEDITVADIDAVAHHLPEADVFAMVDAIAAGKTDTAAALLSELLAGDAEPIMITALIGAQFRSLYAARLSQERGLGAEYLKEVTGKAGFFANKLLQSARGYELSELKKAVRLCSETDYKFKSNSNLSPAENVEELLIRLAMNHHAAH